MNKLTTVIGCTSVLTLAAVSLFAQTPPTNPATTAAPVTAAAPAPAAAEVTNPALRDELLAIRLEDQASRKKLTENKDDEAARTAVTTLDAKHVARLHEIVKENGWPGKSLVGLQASAAAWLVVQHGPKDLLAEMLPIMKAAAEKGDLAKSLVASSEDRGLVNEGKKQLYGTQFDTKDGKFEPFPIEDPDHVDERRKSMGLGTLESYTELMKKTYHITTPAPASTPAAPAPPAPSPQ